MADRTADRVEPDRAEPDRAGADLVATDRVGGDDTLLILADAAGAHRWRLLSGGAVVGLGNEIAELPEARPWVRIVLAVPGTDVTLRWLDLADNLTAPQAAAAARLQMAEDTAEPIGDLHIAAGRRESGLTPVALTPAGRMTSWLAAARERGLEPDLILPTPMLLQPPADGLVRYAGDGVPDYRGTARAFSLEDDLAALVLGDTAVTEVDSATRDRGLAAVLADPPINLRQGAFARRREFAIDWVRTRRLALFGAILLLLTLAIQVVTILRTRLAAARVQAEATELRRAIPTKGPRAVQAAVSFSPAADALFSAVRDTPNAQLGQVIYQPGGVLRASITADSPATIEALRARVEAAGMQAQGGAAASVGGRAAADLTISPRG